MISFVITTFNRPSLLQKCVESIYNLKLNSDFEIVVSDDCSEPDSIEFVRGIKGIKLLESETNAGLAANINRGLMVSKGDYIVYLQDDWLLRNIFKDRILEMCDLLDNERLEMIRLTSNVKFNAMNRLSKHIWSIPRFAFRNIPNYRWRYSDHPYIVKRDFFNKYGYYLEQTSTLYGETEYSIRLMKLNPRIGLINPFVAKEASNQVSVRDDVRMNPRKNIKSRLRKSIQYWGWLRFEFEATLYNTSKRSLLTYKNYRKG